MEAVEIKRARAFDAEILETVGRLEGVPEIAPLVSNIIAQRRAMLPEKEKITLAAQKLQQYYAIRAKAITTKWNAIQTMKTSLGTPAFEPAFKEFRRAVYDDGRMHQIAITNIAAALAEFNDIRGRALAYPSVKVLAGSDQDSHMLGQALERLLEGILASLQVIYRDVATEGAALDDEKIFIEEIKQYTISTIPAGDKTVLASLNSLAKEVLKERNSLAEAMAQMNASKTEAETLLGECATAWEKMKIKIATYTNPLRIAKGVALGTVGSGAAAGAYSLVTSPIAALATLIAFAGIIDFALLLMSSFVKEDEHKLDFWKIS